MIAFIVTNYNNSSYTVSLYRSIAMMHNDNAQLIIVDNGSLPTDVQCLDSLADNNENVHLIKNNINVGYFAGLNIGIRYARDKYLDIKCLVIGNNDLVFPSDFFQQLDKCQSVLDKYPVVSPNIRMLDGVSQNPHVIHRISKMREFVYDLYYSSYWLAGLIVLVAKWTHRFTDRKDEQQHAIAQEIHQGYGACYILTPKFFEYFDELWAPTFLMYEEFFLSKQLEGKDIKIYYEPRILVNHHCHASTGDLPGKLRWEIAKRAHKEYRKYVKFWR